MDTPKTMSIAVVPPPEYFLNGVTHSLFEVYSSKEATVIASSLSVLVVLMIGSCVWCAVKFCSHKKYSEETDNSNGELGADGFQKLFINSLEEPTNLCGRNNQILPSEMKSSQKKDYKLKIHQNIITPDRKIEFFVPTISLPAQPQASHLDNAFCIKHNDLSPEPSCSSSNALKRGPNHYPQLETSENVSPKIGFSLYYEAGAQVLYVRLLGGENFPQDMRYYIVVKIYPGRGVKQQTKEMLNEATPIYNQEFNFHVRKSTLNTRILKMKAVIPGNPKRILGCINIALKDMYGFGNDNGEEDLQSKPMWKRLDQPSDNAEGVRLQVSLQWAEEPQPGLLTLKVIEAIGLHESNENDYTSTHVKVTLQEQGRNIKTRKSRLIRWGSVPVFDDVFVVTIPQDLLSQISFLLEFIARGRLGSKAVLGKISIGSLPFANPSAGGVDFWEDMCHQPNAELVRWLQLKP